MTAPPWCTIECSECGAFQHWQLEATTPAAVSAEIARHAETLHSADCWVTAPTSLLLSSPELRSVFDDPERAE